MPRRRSIVLHGLRLTLRVRGALLWVYGLNLGVALLFSLRLHAQLGSLLDHSMAAERLNAGFDLGSLIAAIDRLGYRAPSSGISSYVGLPIYVLGYFVLVPGTLFCMEAAAPTRLAILLSQGLSFFWRFVRITLLSAVAAAVLLGPLIWANNAWGNWVDDHVVGNAAMVYEGIGWLAILLVAMGLRLYFDLVEVYTVQLAEQYRPDGFADRRVRKTLGPAWRTLWANVTRAYGSFVLLTLGGAAAMLLTGRVAVLMLAQPRVWPAFLLTQLGLFLMLVSRFWQRGAETVLATDYPLAMPPPPDVGVYTGPISRYTPEPIVEDAQSEPEPAAPSLDAPDPSIFHHEPGVE